MSSRLTINRSAVKDRRGFGLFSDDEDDSDIERTPVSFSGNKSGFQVLGTVGSPGDAGSMFAKFSLFPEPTRRIRRTIILTVCSFLLTVMIQIPVLRPQLPA